MKGQIFYSSYSLTKSQSIDSENYPSDSKASGTPDYNNQLTYSTTKPGKAAMELHCTQSVNSFTNLLHRLCLIDLYVDLSINKSCSRLQTLETQTDSKSYSSYTNK